MSDNELVPQRQKTIAELDGFSGYTNAIEGEEDARADTRVIVGEKLKFNDPIWTLSGTDVTGRLFTAIGIRNAVTKWGLNGKPLETEILAPGVRFPYLRPRNEACPKSEWRMAFGRLVGPWSNHSYVYFIDEDMNKFCWPSQKDTVGSSICVRELADDIQLIRKFRGPNVYLVVELSHTDFNTQYRLRQRPKLINRKPVTLESNVGEMPAPAVLELAASGAPADAQPVAPVTLQEELGDSILY
jgi:hypothetical protein